jgi:hypothetical protein
MCAECFRRDELPIIEPPSFRRGRQPLAFVRSVISLAPKFLPVAMLAILATLPLGVIRLDAPVPRVFFSTRIKSVG